MNQKMDLQVPALNLEKIIALVATDLNVEPVELVLLPLWDALGFRQVAKNVMQLQQQNPRDFNNSPSIKL